MKKKINGFEDYEIYSDGRVYSTSSGLFLAGSDNKGYRVVKLYDHRGGFKIKFVHRLVAEHFVENRFNKPEVNHIDEDKYNNDVSNLEWVTAKENNNYGSRIEKSVKKLRNGKRSQQVRLWNAKGDELLFESINEAKRNGYAADVVLCGRARTTKGFFVEKTGVIK